MSKIDIAKKIKALADQGFYGEKQAAASILENYVKKHNISMDDLDDEKIERIFFNMGTDDKVELLHQIMKNISTDLCLYGPLPKKDIKKYDFEGNFFTECTHIQSIEIQAKYNYYLNLYKKESEIFYRAFIHKNNLYSGKSEKSLSQLNHDELKELLKVISLAKDIEKGEFHKQLT